MLVCQEDHKPDGQCDQDGQHGLNASILLYRRFRRKSPEITCNFRHPNVFFNTSPCYSQFACRKPCSGLVQLGVAADVVMGNGWKARRNAMKNTKILKPVLAVIFVVAFWQISQTLDAQHPGGSGQRLTSFKNSDSNQAPPIESFLQLTGSRRESTEAISRIERTPHPGNTAMLMEILPYVSSYGAQAQVVKMIERDTGVRQTRDSNAWFQEIWRKEYNPNPRYAEFKSRLYRKIDPRFAEYFANDRQSTIRLDEVRWGGVARDGIPPLKDPITTTASEATYLADSDIVFGVVVNGEARAYPKRILAWHEMVKDTVGGTPINGVYCTLCGSMIVYFPKDDTGLHHELGTSGFLYRSNKLMYDHATKSMWSTIKGEPVIGPLVGRGIKLPVHNVVTTNWGQWKSDHPATRVLSLQTGHHRDYGEGVAYRDYFATDRLMFTVPSEDRRLKNKDEVFIIRHDENEEPLAIAADFLSQNPTYHDKIADLDFVVATDASGANRAFESGQHKFQAGAARNQLTDETGRVWKVTEEALVAADDEERLKRLPSHRAFWFGWYAVHPQTRLIK